MSLPNQTIMDLKEKNFIKLINKNTLQTNTNRTLLLQVRLLKF